MPGNSSLADLDFNMLAQAVSLVQQGMSPQVAVATATAAVAASTDAGAAAAAAAVQSLSLISVGEVAISIGTIAGALGVSVLAVAGALVAGVMLAGVAAAGSFVVYLVEAIPASERMGVLETAMADMAKGTIDQVLALLMIGVLGKAAVDAFVKDGKVTPELLAAISRLQALIEKYGLAAVDAALLQAKDLDELQRLLEGKPASSDTPEPSKTPAPGSGRAFKN